VPQDVYDALFEIQLEVVNNFTYDYAIMKKQKSSPYGYAPTKEDYYRHGGGVCDDYANLFILLAQEKGLTENLYKVCGTGLGSGHAWLEYRTEENVYIIDPTWSDDYTYGKNETKQLFRESPAYGKGAFFITYAEDKLIFQGYTHSTFKVYSREQVTNEK
jgi:transglutaminase/protease-like cytokinesis protein 3